MKAEPAVVKEQRAEQLSRQLKEEQVFQGHAEDVEFNELYFAREQR
jgi:hypothetical protein